MLPRSNESPMRTVSLASVVLEPFESPSIDPKGAYPSDVTPVSLTPTTHGNGFFNTGALDVVKASPLPDSASVRFDTAGTYTYYCLIHPFMRGTVTVQ